MITLSEAENALKNIYLGTMSNHIDKEYVRKYGRA